MTPIVHEMSAISLIAANHFDLFEINRTPWDPVANYRAEMVGELTEW